MPVLQRLIPDARFAARMLRRQPGLTATALLSLTLGITASTILFTFVKAVFMPVLPVKDPSGLVVIYSTTQGRTGTLIEYQTTSFLNARDYQSRNTVFSGLAVIIDSVCMLERGDRSSGVVLNLITADYFEVLGIRLERGRAILSQDNDPNSSPVVVVSHALWASQLGGDERVLGRSILLNGHAYTIVGVMPAGFANVGALPAADVWIPAVWHDLVLTGSIHDWYNLRAARVASMVARLKPHVSPREADASMRTIGAQLQKEYPNDNAGRNVMVVPLAHTVVPPSQRAMYIRASLVISAIVAIVLLIACSNVAHLLLARALHRHGEFNLRVALGATRRDVAGQLLIEGVLLAAVACVLGLLSAYWAKYAVTMLVPTSLRGNLDFALDTRVILFAVGISAVTTVTFALGPAWRASRSLGMGYSRAIETHVSGSSGRVHRLLVIGQIGLAVVVLVTAGLFIRSLQAAQRSNLGFDLDRQVVLSVDFVSLHYRSPRVRTFYDTVTQRLSTLPAVAGVALSDTAPLSGSYRRTVFPADVDTSDPSNGRLTGVISVSPRFIDTIGMRLLRGRDFDNRDDADRPLVALVNEAAARTLWPAGGDPIGKRLRFLLQDWDISVVGLVNTVTYASVNEAPQPIIYVPMKQHLSDRGTVYVRTTGDPGAVAQSVRAEVASLEPALASTRIRTGRQELDQLLIERRLGAQLLGAFGLVALLLAVLGTYGVVSYTVGQTRREIGIRVALGSTRVDVFRRALAHNVAYVMAGVVLGIVLETLVIRSTAHLLYGIDAFDPVSFSAAAALLLATAFIACAVPVWRATSVDPMIVLRSE